MGKRQLIGILIAVIGICIAIYGFSISSDLAENKIFRSSGILIFFAGIFTIPEYKKVKR
ncbi:hypothetical protein [Bacillus sp. JJ722]|uniref:hypothetical protein n=1 Tax=Bacillus sp. JJ722 TaxID=3122973 RepID=UPI002FFF15A7